MWLELVSIITFVGFVIWLFSDDADQKQPMVVDIIYYPVKSAAGIHLMSSDIGKHGIVRDREWAVYDPDTKEIITQREDPNLVKLQPIFEFNMKGDPQNLLLSYPERQLCRLNVETAGPSFDFVLFRKAGSGMDMGEEAAAWLQETFDANYRLARIMKHRNCKLDPRMADNPLVYEKDEITFSDTAHLLVVSEKSFTELHMKVPRYKRLTLQMENYRPNIIVRNCKSFAEDTWLKIQIGDVVLRGGLPSTKCRLSTLDLTTLKFDNNFEPVKTLNKWRTYNGTGCFGHNYFVENDGFIKVGDKVTILKKKKPEVVTVS